MSSPRSTLAVLARRQPAPVDALTGLCQIVLDLRLVALLLTVIPLGLAGERSGWLLATLLAGAVASYIPLRRWQRVGPWLARHPLVLGADVAFAVVVLALTGSTSPFFYFTVGTAALAGILHGPRGAAVFSALLVLGYWAVLGLEAGAGGTGAPASFQSLAGLPALYPLTAAVGVGLRRLLERQAATAEAAATAEERLRLARELHDSVSKTLLGMELAAGALPAWVERDGATAAAQARALAGAARTASRQARELIGCLRADHSEEPLDGAVRSLAERWGAAARVAVTVDAAPAELGATARYELVCVLREALANVERHAGASRVAVRLRAVDGGVELEVRDDGRGFEPPADVVGLQSAGHYGIVGMHERARRAGGELELRSAPGRGTRLRVRLAGAAAPAALLAREAVP